MKTTKEERQAWMLGAAKHGARDITQYSAGITVDQLVRLLDDVDELEREREKTNALIMQYQKEAKEIADFAFDRAKNLLVDTIQKLTDTVLNLSDERSRLRAALNEVIEGDSLDSAHATAFRALSIAPVTWDDK